MATGRVFMFTGGSVDSGVNVQHCRSGFMQLAVNEKGEN